MLIARWSQGASAREQKLEAENRGLRELLAQLTDRLENLQHANEQSYAAEYDRTGGPCFDPSQTFGTDPQRPLGTLPMSGGAS